MSEDLMAMFRFFAFLGTALFVIVSLSPHSDTKGRIVVMFASVILTAIGTRFGWK